MLSRHTRPAILGAVRCDRDRAKGGVPPAARSLLHLLLLPPKQRARSRPRHSPSSGPSARSSAFCRTRARATRCCRVESEFRNFRKQVSVRARQLSPASPSTRASIRCFWAVATLARMPASRLLWLGPSCSRRRKSRCADPRVHSARAVRWPQEAERNIGHPISVSHWPGSSVSRKPIR
jgi:hypothetical protein